MYQDDARVASIHGYVYPIKGLPPTFFLRGADCWGWATWVDRWQHFDYNAIRLLNTLKRERLINYFDFQGGYGYSKMLKAHIKGKVDSWDVCWYASLFL